MRSALLHSSAVPSFGLKEPVIAVRVAQAWLALGCIAVLCLPASRGYSEWIGWLPLWLVIMPAAQLAMLRWRLLASASRKSWRRLSHFHGDCNRPAAIPSGDAPIDFIQQQSTQNIDQPIIRTAS